MTIVTKLPVAYRLPLERDQIFVTANLLNQIRGTGFNHLIPKDFWNVYWIRSLDILKTSGASVYVAYNPDDIYQLFGFIIYQKLDNDLTVLHWIFVKDEFRGIGIAQMLMKEAGFDLNEAIHFTIPGRKVPLLSRSYKLNYLPLHMLIEQGYIKGKI